MTLVRRCKSFHAFFAALIFFALCVQLRAQDVQIALEPVIASGLTLPVYITHAHDGTNRRFIVEQTGIISVLQPGSSTRATFLDIRTRVLSGGERGLLGLAFHPQFPSNGRFFVDYTRQPDGATVIAEYRVSSTNPNVANPAESVLLTIPQPYENHNGGMVEFGPDGYLYIGMGDGGAANDPQNRAQNVDELLGKILRIDVNSAFPPPSNPYVGLPGRDEIYAIGMRNPWRFSFDRATGQLYVGDVGQDQVEEVDIVTAGGNYGWRVLEGSRCTGLGPASCSTPGFIPPIAEYTHANGRCSITGGYVYRGSQQSLPLGAYIYGDYCSGEIFILQGGVQSVLLDTGFNISSFGEDQDGELYVVNLGGAIYRIRNPNATTVSARGFSLADRGSSTFVSEGVVNPISGYARIQADAGSVLPAALSIFGKRSNGILVSEASVPAMPLTSSGRIYVDTTPGVKTGVAFANPNNSAVQIDFYFTDGAGNNFGGASTVLAAGSQMATFLDQPPFNQPGSVSRSSPITFTFSTSQLVSVLALRGLMDPRTAFLMTTLPVVDLSAPPSGVQVIPQFVSGGGWYTQFQLVNPTDMTINGSIEAFDPAGLSAALSSPVSSYSIPPRSSMGFLTTALGPLKVGSLRITPSPGSVPPSVSAVFTLTSDGVIPVSQGGILATPAGTAFRMFVENLGTDFSAGTVHTGISIANPTGSAVLVSLELFSSAGESTGLTANLSLAANGQTALFLQQVPGFERLPARFQGVLRVTAAAPVVLAGLRGHYNERNQFLFAAAPPVLENAVPSSSELMFPHVFTGAGYDMEFVFFSPRSQRSSGTAYFFDVNGNPLSLPLR